MGIPRPSGSLGLAALLDDELAFDATTSTRLSNHLPMALVALQRLGASDERLVSFAERYRARLAPIEDSAPIATFDEWLAARGRRGTYGAMRGYFDAVVGADGTDAVVRRHLEHLIDGISGAAFHGLIRLAYAVESASDARIAAGLAYLSEVHQPLGTRGSSAPWTADPGAALRRLADVTVLQRLARSGNIGERMRQIAAHPSFGGVVDWLAVTDDTPQQLTDAAIALYAATDDFTALHAVTASHAIAVVTGYVDDRDALAAWWFQALAAAYVTIGAPRLADPARALSPWLGAPTAWPQIADVASRSDDEHVIKLVYSASELSERCDAAMLQAVAARKAGVVVGEDVAG